MVADGAVLGTNVEGIGCGLCGWRGLNFNGQERGRREAQVGDVHDGSGESDFVILAMTRSVDF